MDGTVNVELLTKLLRLTTSPFDGEALTAIRKANEHLQLRNATWDDFVEKLKPKQSSTEARGNTGSRVNWDAVITDLLKGVRSERGREFLFSVRTQWRTKGRLSAAQIAAINKFRRGYGNG